MEEKYFDFYGNERTLRWMIRHEPEWAIRHIRQKHGELNEQKRIIHTLMNAFEDIYATTSENKIARIAQGAIGFYRKFLEEETREKETPKT